MKLNTFEDLFNILLADAFFVEQNILKFFPKVLDKVDSDDLKDAIRKHQLETKEHVRRLEKIYQLKKQEVQHMEWENPLANLFTYAENFLVENPSSPLLDASIIAILQQIEHVEMALYGTLKEYAKQLNEPHMTELLNETLKEEDKTDTALNNLAKGGFFREGINTKAIQAFVGK